MDFKRQNRFSSPLFCLDNTVLNEYLKLKIDNAVDNIVVAIPIRAGSIPNAFFSTIWHRPTLIATRNTLRGIKDYVFRRVL